MKAHDVCIWFDLNGAFAGTPIHKPVVEAIAKAQPELPIQMVAVSAH